MQNTADKQERSRLALITPNIFTLTCSRPQVAVVHSN